MLGRVFLLSAVFLYPTAIMGSPDAGSIVASPSQDGWTAPGSAAVFTLAETLSASDLGERDVRVVAVQVMLDRSRHSPGVIDGYMGGNTRRAIRYYRAGNGLPGGDSIDEPLVRSLMERQDAEVFRTYTISDSDVAGPFIDVPEGMAAMARLDHVGYATVREKLAERFHMDERFLAALNPGADFDRPGTAINVVARGDDELDADVARIEIRKDEGTVAAMDAEGTILASYPATIGSGEFPSPNGSMEVSAVAPEAAYFFDPRGRAWGPDRRLEIAPGPNNPVGGIWIGLTKEGYGIHGSPEPSKISKQSSHGCVRLTNWDAEELAGAVSLGTTVVFV